MRRSWPNWRRAACGAKIPGLEQALAGRVREHHRFMWREVLEHIDELNTRLLTLNARIRELTAPYESIIERLDAIPGVDRCTAEVILAEIGPNVTPFPDGQASGLVGLSVSRQQHQRQQAAQRQDPARPQLAAHRLGRSRLGRVPDQGYLSQLAIPSPASPPRRQARRGRRRPFHLDRGLSPPGQARSGLHRTRWRLLPETQSGAGATPSCPEARRAGVHRHADPSRRNRSYGCLISHQPGVVAVSSARPAGHVLGSCSLETVSATVQWTCFSGQVHPSGTTRSLSRSML